MELFCFNGLETVCRNQTPTPLEHVLRDADEPLHYGVLAERIMERQLVVTRSQTPTLRLMHR